MMKRENRRGYGSARISVKLAILYMLLLLTSWGIIFFIFYRLSYQNAVHSAQTLAAQTQSTVNSNISTLIQNVAYYSRLILSNDDIIAALEEKDVRKQEESLYQFNALIDSQTHINGVYLWDMDSNGCSIDKNHVRTLRTEKIPDATWYEEVQALDGSFCLKLNADKILTKSGADPAVSMIRMVNHPADYNPVGILMINIDLEAFVACYSSMDDQNVSAIYILDETGKIVTSRAQIKLPKWQQLFGNNEDGESKIVQLEEETCLLSETVMEETGWKVLVGVPVKKSLSGTGTAGMLFMLALLFLALFCGAGYMMMKYYVADPLEHFASSMNRMKGRKFEKIVTERTGGTFAEMQIVQDTYNQMVDEIEALIDKVYEEEKVKRKAELNALQEQMKPHFLYNTIDAMGYLALSGKKEEVYDALEAFGSYYRTLLSKGREMITVQEEVTMVRDYLELQKLRYGESLHYVLEIDDSIRRVFILKMVLQPLVENSVNHGIRPKCQPGVVYVAGKISEGALLFIVEDDGVGMEETEIDLLQKENLDSNEKSFGLRGTIERLRIFYDEDIEYQITSKKGKGTTIVLRVPIRYEEEQSAITDMEPL